MKKNIFLCMLFIAFLGWQGHAQDCQNTEKYPTSAVTPNPTGESTEISDCNSWQDYSEIEGIISGYEYEFNSVKGSETAFVTVRIGSVGGPVLDSGFGPLTITATSGDNLFVHWNADATCGTSTGCAVSTVSCVTCATVADCEGIPGGPAQPGTACDDGDPNTLNDVWNADCNCAGVPPAAGDVCDLAIAIDCNVDPVTYSSTTSNATNTTECSMGDNGLWFSFMGTGNDITVNSSATFDHALSVNTGSCGTLTSIVCQDGSTAAENYTILSSVENQMYYVYIAHKSSGNTTTGNIQISIDCAAPQYPPVVELNSAADYGVLATVGITSAGTSVIRNTNIGVNPATRAAITGFPPSEVINGEIHASDTSAPIQAKLAQAQLDLTAAYNFAAGASVPAPATIAGDQGGKTLYPGIYKSTSSLKIQNGDLTLDAQGDPNARWIFQIASTLTTVSGGAGNVILTGGAQSKNITWQVGTSATIATSFKGNILAGVSVTMGVGSTSDGRLYALNGLVALSGNILIDQPCPAPKNLAVPSYTEDSADITWTEGSNETEWEVKYGPANFEPNGTEGSTVSVSIDPETTLNNLDGGTDYDVYVRAICDVVNEIEWTGPVSFSTFCGIATVPYLLDFDSVVVPNLPDCTSMENTGIGTDWKTKDNISQFTGNVLNYSAHTAVGNANSWFYTQGVELSTGTNYQISYRYGNLSTTSTERMKVAYGISPTETSMTRTLADYPTISTTAPLDDLITFTVATDGVYYFGFNAYSSENQNQLYVDDISIVKEIKTYVYENLVWTPGDPSGVSTSSDNINIINGTTSLTANTAVNDLTIQSGATLNIDKVLYLSGNITNNGDMVFKSTATSDGELAEVPSGSTITGNVTVERYMSANRSYRFVSSAVTTTGSIHANWQEGASSATDDPNPGFGTHITGTLETDTDHHGFDVTISGNKSLFRLNVGSQAFDTINNTNNNMLTAGDDYLLFVRGSRAIDLTANPAPTADETVLRATGTLLTGDMTKSLGTVASGNFVAIANPYQSAINANTVIDNSANLNDASVFVYDPTLAGGSGAYATVDLESGMASGSDANQFIQPGQAVQVATSSTGNTEVVFGEADKAPGNHTATFSNENPFVDNAHINGHLFTTANYAAGKTMHDNFSVLFNQSFDNALNNKDAVKPMNFKENMGIGTPSQAYSIERRELPIENEDIALFNTNYENQDYTLVLEVSEFEGTTPYFVDNYTGEQTELQVGENVISFSVDQNVAGSIVSNRFYIHFGPSTLSVDNSQADYGIQLYPNPTESGAAFYVTAGQFEGQNVSVSITDLLGKTVYNTTKQFNAGKIAIQPDSPLGSGVYFVRIAQDGKTVNKRLVVK